MNYKDITGAPNASQLNLSNFSDQIPVGSSIRCIVTAEGLLADRTPETIEVNTNAVLVTEPSGPGADPPPTIESLSLTSWEVGSPVTGTAIIDYVGGTSLQDLLDDGWSVNWEWSFENFEGDDGESTDANIDGIWKIEPGDMPFRDDEHGIEYSFQDYANVDRGIFNDHVPDILFKPKNAQEVIRILNYCDAESKEFRVRSGTHSYNGEGTGDGVVIIDMRLIDTVTVDTTNEWMDVGGGATLWQTNAALDYEPADPTASSSYGETDTQEYNNVRQSTGYWTPSGSCPHVGFSSVASGGGISGYPNRVGLMCDLILEIDIVIPKSGGGYQEVTATATNQYSDLLDGIRGLGNSSLGIITRIRSKILERRNTHFMRVGLSWRYGQHFNADDENLWAIHNLNNEPDFWENAHETDEWKFGKAVYTSYQDLLMGNETWPDDHPEASLRGEEIWPHGETNGIDGTFYMWANHSNPGVGWDYSITYHIQLDCFDGDHGTVPDPNNSATPVPAHMYYLANEIVERAIAKQTGDEFERFREGTERGTPTNAIRYQSVTGPETQGISDWMNPVTNDVIKQTNGSAGAAWSTNGALTIPNNSPNDEAVAEATFQFYRDIITDINPLANPTGSGKEGIYYRFYTHSSCPNGPVADPQIHTHDLAKDVLGWRDRPNEIQLYEAYPGSQEAQFWDKTTHELTDLGKQFQQRRVQYFNEMISLYGGDDPRSYIGYIDSMVNHYTLPNGNPIDVNKFYYGDGGVTNLTTLKDKYDPSDKFPTGPVMKTIDIGELPSSSMARLEDGGVDPKDWAPFALSGLVYDASEPFNYPVSGRFITPPYFAHDDDDHKYISIVAPPYQGVIDDGSGTLRYNKLDRIEFYLNGDISKVIVTEPESVTRGYDCYTVEHPFDLTTSDTMKKTNEVRAIIYYEKGEPRILQGMVEPNVDINPLDGDGIPIAELVGVQDPKAITMSADFSWNNRGCFIGKYEDYYVGPLGNDGNDGKLSPVLTPSEAYAKAYANGHTNIRVNNSHVCTIGDELGPNADLTGPAAAYTGYDLTQFFKEGRGLDYNGTSGTPVGGDPSDFVHRETLPAIVQGGEMWVNNLAATITFAHGALFKNCNMILNASVGSTNKGYTYFLRNKNKGDRFRRWTDYCAVMFDGCTIGPKEKTDSKGGGFGSIEDHSYRDTVGGYSLTLSDNGSYYTGNNAAYNCTINYGVGNSGQEMVDCDMICPPTQNDIVNYTMIVNTNIYDVNKHYYPWGSLGSPDGAGAGEESVEFGVPISKDRADNLGLHNTLSYSETYSNTQTSIAERIPYTNNPTEFNSVHLPYDKGFWPDYTMAGIKGVDRLDGSPATLNQTNINMSGISRYDTADPLSPWYGKKFNDNPRDPHFDVQQFNEVRKNVIVHRMKVESARGNFQGIFTADEARIESGAFWNITWNAPGNQGQSMMLIGSTDENNNNPSIPTGQFIHYGPDIFAFEGTNVFLPRDVMSNGTNDNKDVWIYDKNLDGDWTSIREWNDSLTTGAVHEVSRSAPLTGLRYTQVKIPDID